MKKIDAAGKVVYICAGKKCSRHGDEVYKALKEIIKEKGLKKDVDIIHTECTGNCKCAPVISLQPQNIWIGQVDGKDIKRIFEKYIG
jgi:NADH:ubiquinone oxidoreductase subunit E